MTSGTRLLVLGEMAAPAGEANFQTPTLGMIHTASVFPPGQVNGFRSKMNVSSYRSGLRTALLLLSCADSRLAAPTKPQHRVKKSRRFRLFIGPPVAQW